MDVDVGSAGITYDKLLAVIREVRGGREGGKERGQ